MASISTSPTASTTTTSGGGEGERESGLACAAGGEGERESGLACAAGGEGERKSANGSLSNLIGLSVGLSVCHDEDSSKFVGEIVLDSFVFFIFFAMDFASLLSFMTRWQRLQRGIRSWSLKLASSHRTWATKRLRAGRCRKHGSDQYVIVIAGAYAKGQRSLSLAAIRIAGANAGKNM